MCPVGALYTEYSDCLRCYEYDGTVRWRVHGAEAMAIGLVDTVLAALGTVKSYYCRLAITAW